MVQAPIYESDAKSILKRNKKFDGIKIFDNLIIEKLDDLDKINLKFPDQKLVVKPDTCVKGRFKAGLVCLDFSHHQVSNWLIQNFNKTHKIGKLEGNVDRFIIEPFLNHPPESEHYLCFSCDKEYDHILYCEAGGVDIGDVNEKAIKINVKINEKIEIKHFEEVNFKIFKNKFLVDFIIDLFEIYRNLHFCYLEFNPFIVFAKSSEVYIVDVAAKVDTCADFLCHNEWKLTCFPKSFGKKSSAAEEYIAHLDSTSGASLKFVLLNKDARIWTMIAGGGASVIYSDTICNLGYAHDLANYGEYSGAPTEDETYEYTKTILTEMAQSRVSPGGKILIIGGGIANFTNVATTFKGIVRALIEKIDDLKHHNLAIYVRRGGPNYEEGLKFIQDSCKEIGIRCFVFGIGKTMTSIISMALGLKPTSGEICFYTKKPMKLPRKPEYFEESLVVSEPVKESSNLLFDTETTAIIWGFQEIAIQGMLDFDYVCQRDKPSVACMIYPFRASIISKFYFGLTEILIPIYGTFEEATQKFPQATILINFASMRSSYETSLEALKFPQFKVISIFAEGIPERQTQLLNIKAKEQGVMVIGPASIGGIKPGSFRIAHAGGNINNIVSSKLHRPGSVCYITRSGGMSNELNNILSDFTDGVLEGIHLGGDRYPGTSYMDHINRFLQYSDLQLIIILGEVGGLEEYNIVKALKNKEIPVPLIAWCIGTCASFFDSNIQFGHANACANFEAETAAAKNKALRKAGARVPDSFDDFIDLIIDIYKKRVSSGKWIPKPDTWPPPIPVDYKYACDRGLIRKPTSFISTICDERKNEPTYSGIPISEVLDKNMGIGGTIGLLWFQRIFPDYMNKFFEMCVIILADHGPAVSGAHNAIVTARAGKDMLSSLCSGLLTIGDRFGGAINGAADQFWSAFTNKQTPSEFVNDMRKKGQLIMGIGHLVKSVTNPDERVKKIVQYVRSNQPTPLLDYALEVEKITTSKKSNLILNVDGAIGVCLIDMMLHSKLFTVDDVQNYIKIGTFNAIFILARTIGFIGHFLDQKRLKQGIYRHPWDDITFMNCFDINK